MIYTMLAAAVHADSAGTCSDLQGYYRSMTCCGKPDQLVSCTDNTTRPLSESAARALLPPCTRELLADEACDSKSFSQYNFGSFECDASGESFCDAADFRPNMPASLISGYGVSLPANFNSGLMWARSVVSDGDYLFVQLSRSAGSKRSQYGMTGNRGYVLKIEKATGTVVASQEMDGRWAPTIAKASDGKKYVYTVHSHFLVHQRLMYSAIFAAAGLGPYPGNPSYSLANEGPTGHWIFKLDYETLAIVSKREVSVDHDLVEPRLSKMARDAIDFSSAASAATYQSDTVGTTQLNGFISSYEDATLCPGGVLLFTGISGYPYYYTLNDEPQNRPLGQLGQRNTGRGMAYCSNDLLPKWDNPASNGYMMTPASTEANGDSNNASTYLGAGKKRHMIVGDKIPAEKIRAGQTVTVVASDFPCAGGTTGHNTYALDSLLAKVYTITTSLAITEPALPGDLVKVGDVVFVLEAPPSGNELKLRIKDADYRPMVAGTPVGWYNSTQDAIAIAAEAVLADTDATDPEYGPVYAAATAARANVWASLGGTYAGTAKALVEIPYAESAHYAGGRWKVTAKYHEIDATVEPSGDVHLSRAVVCTPTSLVPAEGETTVDTSTWPPLGFPPLIKTKKAAGTRIETEGERVSLQQHGGSWWSRASAANGLLVTPQGNGHMESTDRYMVFRDFYFRRDKLQTRISRLAVAIEDGQVPDPTLPWAVGDDPNVTVSARALLGLTTRKEVVDAFWAAMRERHDMVTERRALFKKLSLVDYAGVESSIAAYNISTGERAWVASGEAPDVWNVDPAIENYGTLSPTTFMGTDVATHTDAVGFWSHIDAEANNAMIIGDKVMYTTKGASLGTLNAKTGEHIHTNSTSIWPYVEGGNAASNFGGTCYAGGGVAVVHTATNSFDYVNPLTGATVPADHAVMAGYNIHSGKLVWYQVVDTNDRAVGLTCGKGMVFSILPTHKAIGVFNSFTGEKLQELPLDLERYIYNNAQMVVDRDSLYMVTYKSVHKWKLVAASAGTVA